MCIVKPLVFAFGLVAALLGSAVLGYALLGSEEEQHELRRWTPAIVWFAVFVCALVLWRALSTQETRYIQNSTRLVASDIKGQIERELAAHMQLLQRLADRSQIYGFTEEQWRQDAGALLRDVPEFQQAAAHLAVDDLLVDGMRGRSSLWWRVRVNLRHVPEEQRPAAEPPDPDYDPWASVKPEEIEAWRREQSRRRGSRPEESP